MHLHLQNADEIASSLSLAIRDWQPKDVSAPDPTARCTIVEGGPDGYAVRSCYLDETLEGLGSAAATCAVIADLAQDFFETRSGCLALHCAAFRFHNRLIAMTGPSRAGKSTLAARLTMETDMQVFCDDVLPLLDNGKAVGLGIAPRLRLPIPAASSAAFKAHFGRHIGPHDDRYGYLCAPNVAPHGTAVPLSVLLILDRRPIGPALLHEVAEDEALHFLLAQNMSDLETAEAAFARLSDLLTGIKCLRLVYSHLEDAVALIRHAFGTTTDVAADVSVAKALMNPMSAALPRADLSSDLQWSRKPDVVIQRKGDSAFLWHPGNQMIWQTNTLGLAVWTLLEIPSSAREIGTLLSEQFPDQDTDTLISDVNALMQALVQNGLIEPARI